MVGQGLWRVLLPIARDGVRSIRIAQRRAVFSNGALLTHRRVHSVDHVAGRAPRCTTVPGYLVVESAGPESLSRQAAGLHGSPEPVQLAEYECRHNADDVVWRELRKADGNHAAADSGIERVVRLLNGEIDRRGKV